MSEEAFRRRVRDALHQPPSSLCKRLHDAVVAGVPDCFYAFAGRVTFLELKWAAWPKRERTPITVGLTVEQRRYLEELRGAGVAAYVLLGVGRREWWLLDPSDVPANLRVPQAWLRCDERQKGTDLRTLWRVLAARPESPAASG